MSPAPTNTTDAPGGSTVTVAICESATPPAVADTVTVPALLACSDPVATPVASVAADGCVSETPDPEADSVTAAPLTGLLNWSRAVTWIVAAPVDTVIVVGMAATLDCDAEIGPAVTVMVGFWLITTPLAVAVTVFTPAAVELSVPVVMPLELVSVAGCPIVLLPLAARDTVTPGSGVPAASLTVTVIVELPAPATSDAGATVTVDCEADTAPAATLNVPETEPASPLAD